MVANPLHLLEGNRPKALDKLASVHVARQLTRHDRSLLNFDLLKKQNQYDAKLVAGTQHVCMLTVFAAVRV